MPNVVQEQPLLSPRLQVAESRAFIPVDTSSVSPTAREEQRSDKTGESDDAPSTDQEAFVKSDVEEEEVDETMESVSVTVTEYSEEEEEEEREGDEEENDTASEDTMFEESIPQEGEQSHLYSAVCTSDFHPCFYSLAANYS